VGVLTVAVMEPVPTCPDGLFPHITNAPSARIAPEWLSPAMIDETCRLGINVGVATVVAGAIPSWPLPFAPHPYTRPPFVSARVCAWPAAIATMLWRPRRGGPA